MSIRMFIEFLILKRREIHVFIILRNGKMLMID